MNKLKLAHDWAMKRLEDPDYVVPMDEFAAAAWRYADIMQAEAEKRECKERPEVLESIDPKEYIDAVLQDIVEPCDHEWTHISKFGAEGDFYVCPCSAKSKRPQRRTK